MTKKNPKISPEAKRTMNASIAEGSAWGAMNGFAENFVTPFALALGASNAIIGIIAAMRQLIGSAVQELGATLVERSGSRKPLLVWGTSLQSAIWLLIAAIPFFIGDSGLWQYALLILILVYVFLNSISTPAWASLLGDVVPEHERGRFFGRREKIVGFVALTAGVLGGWWLNLFDTKSVLVGFAGLFFAAFVCGQLQAFFFTRHHEPKFSKNGKKTDGLLKFLKNTENNPLGTLVSYSALYQFAVNIAGPFFVVYMLKDLGFSYQQFAVIHALNILATIVTMPYWGVLLDRYGSRRVIQATGLLTAFVPLVWLLNNNPAWIAVAEIYSGVVWAGLNLATNSYVLASTTPEKRPRYVAHFNFVNGMGVFFGALAGGLLATSVEGMHLLSVQGLAAVLLVSGIARLVVYITMIAKVKKPGDHYIPIGETIFFTRLITTYPVKGLQHGIYSSITSLRHLEKKAERKILGWV
ncbi:MAG TPA: MFS transporter [Candidatus Norongarragalinales archaeon]|jgi:MFS family permease|nr:MFS transporter [Candidatus Norongarragalinales archaeon]